MSPTQHSTGYTHDDMTYVFESTKQEYLRPGGPAEEVTCTQYQPQQMPVVREGCETHVEEVRMTGLCRARVLLTITWKLVHLAHMLWQVIPARTMQHRPSVNSNACCRCG